MTLREAQEQLKRLDNEYKFWLKEKEIALSLVIPKATDIGSEKVDGGTREDRMLKYVELLDNKQINETLDYIFKKKQNLMNYIEEELRIIGQYSLIEKKIYDLRNDNDYIKQHGKKMPFWMIGSKIGYSAMQCSRIYKRTINKRSD